MKKTLIIFAALVAFFMLPIMSMTAYAYGDDPNEDESSVVADELPDEYSELPPTITEIPFTPAGTATVVDDATDADGKMFFTIMTPDEHIFYLVIDRQRGTENVYFLNAVTVADLIPLAQMPAPPQGGMIFTPPETGTENEEPEVTPPEPEPERGSNSGVIIFIILLAIGGGVAGWYFKIYRPKQEQLINDNEYEPALAESDNDFTEDWNDDTVDEAEDVPQWNEGDEE